MLSGLLSDLKLFLILTAISLSLMVFDNIGFLNLPKSGLQIVTVPIQFGLYKTSLTLSHQFEFIIAARRASQENKALTEQLAQVLSENSRLRKKLAETEGFLNQQQAFSPQTFTLVAARPVGVSRFLFLDKGSSDGIKLNQAVIYKENYLGKVKEVSPKKSTIMLVSDPDSRVSAFAAGIDGRAKGVLMGQFGADMLMDKILHQEPIKQNDLVYSEGTEVEIPRGLILGQVSQVASRDNEVFKQAKVKTIFDVADLDVVFVITN